MRSFRRVVACNDPTFLIMIAKPEKIIKRIIKAVGSGQSVLVIGDWQEEFIKEIKKKQNIITIESSTENLEDNRFTRIVIDYSSLLLDRRDLLQQTPTTVMSKSLFLEARRLLLPTGMIIISANYRDSILEKIIKIFKKEHIKEEGLKKIKPKELQDQIHDHGFLIDGYYGYPGGHLLMMAQIINKEVSTLFNTEKQETIVK